MYKKSVRLRPLYLYIQSVKIVTRWGYSLLLLLTLTRQPLAERERATRKSSYQHKTWQTSTNKKHSQCWITHSPGVKRSLTTEQTSRPGAVKYSRFVFLILKNPSWHPSLAAHAATPPVPGGPVPVERLSGRVSQPLGVPPSPSEWSQSEKILIN